MPGTHAKLSASASKRWLECPGSVVLEALFGSDEDESPYAEEGTQAHAVAEARLTALFNPRSRKAAAHVKTLKDETDAEMWQFTGQYEAFCKELTDEMALEGHTVRAYIEQRVCFDRWVPAGFGTVDFCAVGGNDLHIVDFKYGKGVPVYADGNTQMRAYALGFLQEMDVIYDNIETVTMHIVQPRINNISSDTITVDELMRWAEEELKPGAERAYRNTREYQPGKHCKFCKAKAVCRTRAEGVLNQITNILNGGKK